MMIGTIKVEVILMIPHKISGFSVGPNLNTDIALGAFKLLSQGILNHMKSLQRNFDLEYTAKFFVSLMYLHLTSNSRRT